MHAEGVSVLSVDRTSGHGILQQAPLRGNTCSVFSETRIFFLSLLPHLMFALEIEHIRGAAQHDPHQIHMELQNISGGTGGMLAK